MAPNGQGSNVGLEAPDLGSVNTSSTLREQVVDALRAAVITGALEPGSLWSAPRLAAHFGVSPTPVREAMLELCSRGLAKPERNRGYRILQLSTKDLEEVFFLRKLLEVPTAGHAAETMKPQDISNLRQLAARTEEMATGGDPTTFLIADRDFHSAIVRSVGNSRLVELTESLRDQTRLYALPGLMESGDLVPFAREHVLIADAIAHRRSAQAVALMQAHFEHTRSIWF